MKQYDPKAIEPKWQGVWADTKVYAATDADNSREKYYYLMEFPYPSGDGLHVGHVLGFTALDIMARHKRMQGYNVLYPIGFDEFGLPTENYAIKHKIAPQVATDRNVENFRRQFKALGISFDWDREVRTADPGYYKWTQWIFLKLLEKGLAYQAELPINWCPFCKTGLANEEVVDGKHERCGTPVEKKLLRQWVLKITAYADRLVEDLKTVDYLDRIATQQINWIGRSEGAEITWALQGLTTGGVKPEVTVYTTRPDTIFGATFLVVSPEVAKSWQAAGWQASQTAADYIDAALKASELSRQEDSKDKTGVDTGVKAIHPLTGDLIPVWVADYVLGSYGTGAIMAVPAHDERDHEFARAFNLPIVPVVEAVTGQPHGGDHEKEAIIAVVYDPKTDRYLMLDWGPRQANWGGMLFIGGGIEPGETDLVEVARREIAEETGYTDVKFMKQSNVRVHNHYFSNVKRRYDLAHVTPILFELQSDKTGGTNMDEGEKGLFKPVWVDAAKVAQTVNDDGHALSFQLLTSDSYIYSGYGPLTNSGQFNGLAGIEAKHAIVEALFKKGAGKGATKYRLRDWIFSRQHYWGEPIPVVHCPGCALSHHQAKLSINFYQQAVWEAITTGAKTVEPRALNPDEPERYFGNVTTGDILKFVNKNTNEERLFRVTVTHRYQSLDELYDHESVADRVSSAGKRGTGADFIASYKNLAPGYLERIQKHGIVAWGIKPLTQVVPIPANQLPVALPKVDHYEPTDTGESPLAAITDWVNTTCPQCGGPAQRETDTMPNWAGSSWYFLRYTDPTNDQAFASPENLKYWTPIDLYNGGMEHTTLHLLYSRFWHKFLYDEGLVPTSEPYARRRSHGMILGPDGQKMSKSKGNVINPDHVIERYGADTIRLYEMFMGPFDEVKAWSEDHLNGVSRFIYRVWGWLQDMTDEAETLPASQGYENDLGAFTVEVDRLVHKTLKKVHQDIQDMHFNTAVSAMMEMMNFLTTEATKTKLHQANAHDLRVRTARTVTLMLAPFTPHLAEEIWHDNLHEEGSIHLAAWPAYNPELIKDDVVAMAVQVNGKLRGNLMMPADATEAEVAAAAQADPAVARHLAGKTIVKTIVVPRRIVNFVVRS